MEASRWQKRRLLRQQYRQHEGPTKKKGKQAVQNQTQEHLQPGDTGKRVRGKTLEIQFAR